MDVRNPSSGTASEGKELGLRKRFRGFSFICCTADETLVSFGDKENLLLEKLASEDEKNDAEQQQWHVQKEQDLEKANTKRSVGGWKTMPFIFGNELCEKLAVVGFSANMVTYLTKQLHLPSVKAANTMTNFGGTASLTPLLGAFLADTYLGRFWTIAGASVIYLMGMVLLTVTATVPWMRPPPCADGKACQEEEAKGWQLALLYVSLSLTALGSGGIRPNVVAFGAEQFDERDPASKKKEWSFFNLYYFCMGVSILVAVTLIVYIQDNISWTIGLGVPAAAMAVSIVAFLMGLPLYRRVRPAGSPLTRLAQVCVAAFRKRRLPLPADDSQLYRDRRRDIAWSPSGVLLHTNHLRFFDRAAIVAGDGEGEGEGEGEGPWRLCTVHQVEELKTIVRMLPIWAAGIMLIVSAAQQYTFSLLQAQHMDRRLGRTKFQIPAGSMTVFTITSLLLWLGIYDRVVVPVARRLTGAARGISFLQRMAVGFAISALATLVAGAVEMHRRRQRLPPEAPMMSVFWLVPQYALFGMAEAFMSVGHLEFFYDQAPESMRSTATALFWTSISAGNYCSTLIVSLVHHLTQPHDWLASDLNHARLHYFYWLLTGLQLLNLIYYLCCARFYTYKPFQVEPLKPSDDEKLQPQQQ